MSGTYLLAQIVGAATLLLWGIRMARTSVMRSYGTTIRTVLPQKLRNRGIALFAGAGAATILQSSTAVAVVIAALAAQGAVPAIGGLAVMLGADVGSAAVALLLSLNVKAFWPLFIAAGYVLHAFGGENHARRRQAGRFFLGLGMVMIALTFMGQASGELAASQTIALILGSLSGEPVLAVLALAALAWLSHSSMAVLLFLASLAGSGIIADPQLIAAGVLGVNLGGSAPAIIMTLRQPNAARRIVWGNGAFRLAGVVLGLVFLDPAVTLFSRLPGGWGLRAVELHIVFNCVILLLFLPFLGRIARLLGRALPDESARQAPAFGPRYIVPAAGSYSADLPLSALTRETLRMSDVVAQMLADTGSLLHSPGDHDARVREIRQMDDKVDTLYKAVRGYAIELTRSDNLPGNAMSRITALFRYAVGLENTGDLIEKSLLDICARKSGSRRSFSEDGDAELTGMFAYVAKTLALAAEVIMTWRAGSAADLLRRDAAFGEMVNGSADRHMERLRRGVAGSMETSSYHLDIINDLHRINGIAASVASDVIAAVREEEEREA